MACLDLPMWYNAYLFQPMRVTGVLNIQVFASCYEASLNETVAIFCADLMDTSNRVYVTQQLYPRISNAISKPSMMLVTEPMFLSGVSLRTYSTWQRTPIKWFLECIQRLFHTSPTRKSGILRTCCGDSFSLLSSTTWASLVSKKFRNHALLLCTLLAFTSHISHAQHWPEHDTVLAQRAHR